jgi:hypothetical protein
VNAAFGHPDQLRDAADLIAAIEDWFLHASDDTVADYRHFFQAFDANQGFDRLVDELGELSTRLRRLAVEHGAVR